MPTIPHHLSPTDYELWTKPQPSMITAIAPSMAIMGQGFAAIEYSIHFNNRAAPRHQHGQGIFKRGVFANDPPLSTCQSCDANGRPIGTAATSYSGTGFTSTPCSTIPYSVRWPGSERDVQLTYDRESFVRLLYLPAFASTRIILECFRRQRQQPLLCHAVLRHRSLLLVCLTSPARL